MRLLEVSESEAIPVATITKLARSEGGVLVSTATGDTYQVNKSYEDVAHEIGSVAISSSGFTLAWPNHGTEDDASTWFSRPVVGFRISRYGIEPIVFGDDAGPTPKTGSIIHPDGKVSDRDGTVHDSVKDWENANVKPSIGEVWP